MGKIIEALETITNPSLPCKDVETSQLALHQRVSWEGVLDLAVNIFFCFGVSHLQLHPPARLSDQLELQALPGLLHGPAPRECSQSHPAGPLQVLPRAGECLLRGWSWLQSQSLLCHSFQPSALKCCPIRGFCADISALGM